jgi:hypothetical protein
MMPRKLILGLAWAASLTFGDPTAAQEFHAVGRAFSVSSQDLPIYLLAF